MEIRKKSYFSFRSHVNIPNNSVINTKLRQDGYFQRLCSSVDTTYKNGGCCLMLLLTYNNRHLPMYYNPLYKEYAPVFNRSHVSKFLNRLKVYSKRKGYCKYKYFICMEYGEDTKRQHYHLMLFVEDSAFYREYVDMVRSIWSENLNYGFVFPDKKVGSYDKALMRSKEGGSSYCSKYVTKDVAYIGEPRVVRLREYYNYLMDNKKYNKALSVLRLFPRVMQSNGIGADLLLQLNANFKECVKNGILNPITKSYAPIPEYIKNKYFYNSVLAFDGRKSKRTDKPLYDRILKASENDYVYYHLSKIDRLALKYYNLLVLDIKSEFDITSLSSTFGNINIMDICKRLVIFRNFSSFYSFNMLEYVKSFDDFFNIDIVKKYLILQSDIYSRFLECSKQYIYSNILTNFYEYFPIFRLMKDTIKYLDERLESEYEERILHNEESYKLKKANIEKKYPVNLC